MQPSEPTSIVVFGGMFVCMFIPMILLLGLWIYALVDVLRREFNGNEKIAWVLVVVLCNWLGALIYLLVGRRNGRL